MSAADILAICNTAVLPAWVLLVVAPRWIWTHRVVVAFAVAIGVVYIGLFVSQIGSIDGSFGSLPEIARLFENPYILTAGWTHFLAFDLFIGSWEVRDARVAGVPHLAVVPCLLLTFMFGPAGLLLYLVFRFARTRTLDLSRPDA